MKRLLTSLVVCLLTSTIAFADGASVSRRHCSSIVAESAQAESPTTYTYTVAANTGEMSGSYGSYKNRWAFTTSESAPVALTLSCPSNNMTTSGSNLQLHEGTSGSSVYTLAVPADYVITGYSFNFVNAGNSAVTITAGNKTATSSTESQTFTVDGLNSYITTFTLVGANKGIVVSNFVVYIASIESETFKVQTLDEFVSGWYSLVAASGSTDGVRQAIANGTNYVVNAPDEYRQNSSNYYALMFAAPDEDKPATSFVYVTKNGNNYLFSSINGHDLNENCTSARNLSTTPTAVSLTNGAFTIGKWSDYSPGNGNMYVGKSSSTSNTFEAHHVTTKFYDIYTVTITGVANATEIGKDARVECVNEANLGLSKVYNNGYYFFPAGTVVDADDFVSAADGYLPSVTIDGEAKTITVNYFEGYSLELYNAVNNAQELLNNTIEGNDPGCYSAAVRAALSEAIATAAALNKTGGADYEAAVATLAAAVDTYKAQVCNVEYSTAESKKWYYIISDSEHKYCNTKAIKSRGIGTALTFADKVLDPSMVWCFEKNEAGKVAIKNYDGNYMSSCQDKNNSAAGMTATAAYNYTIERWQGTSPTALAYTIKSDASSNPLHAQEANTVIVTWAAADNNASLWRFVTLSDEELASTAELASSTVELATTATGIGNTHAPLLRICLNVAGLNGSLQFGGLKGNLGNNESVADKLYLYKADDEFEYRQGRSGVSLIGEATPEADGTFSFEFENIQELPTGISPYYWLVADISEEATEGAVIDASISSYTVGSVDVAATNGNPEHSTTVFLTASTVEYLNTHDSRYYRIPAIATAMNGWLVAVTDKRFSSNGDLPNNIDVVARVSNDNGKTWSEPVTIAGTEALGGNYGHGDPAIVTDRITGDIFVLVTSKVGFYSGTPTEPARLKVIVSHDNGLTWDAPVDITDQIYGAGCDDETRSQWYSMFFSSGAALQTSKGTLMCVAPVRTTNTSNHSLFEAQILRSDDHGKTWTCNAIPALTDADESKIVELNDGRLLVKSRKQGGGKVYYSISDDDGASWSTRAQFSEVYDPGCNGDIIRLTSENKNEGANRLLLSIPDATSRKNVTVYLSTDEAQTWPVKKTICAGGSAYSSMTVLDDGTIGIYYEEDGLEGGYQMRYVRFSLDWLTKEQETPDNVNADLFTAARLKEAQALAVKLPEISEDIESAANAANVGEYVSLYNVSPEVAAALAAAANSNDLQAIQDALTEYMKGYGSTLILPRDGKVYRIKNVITNTTAGYENHYLQNAGGMFSVTAEGDKALWVCQQSAQGDTRTFVSAVADKYLAWKGLSGTSAHSYKISAGKEPGTLALWSAGNSRYLAVTNEYFNSTSGESAVAYNQSTTTTQNTNWSTDFVFEEVDETEYAGFAASVYAGSNANYGTLNLPFAVYMPQGVKALGVSYDAANAYDELAEYELLLNNGILPANTPVLLTSETAQAYTFVPAPALGTSPLATGFKGTLSATAITDDNAYIMAYESGAGSEIRFYLLDGNDNVVNANKAYFVINGANATHSLRLGGNATAIESITDKQGNGAVYDLSGRKLDAISSPGIYIVNGKKVIVR